MWRRVFDTLWIVAALLFMVTAVVWQCERRDEAAAPAADTVRVTLTDTVRLTVPEVRDSVVVRYVVRRMAMPRAYPTDSMDGPEPDNDSAAVIVPITRKEYKGEDYTAWVSGYMASLDSIAIIRRTERVTIRDKPKRWSVGIQAGVGIGADGRQRFGPYVGIGVTYNLFSF